MMAQQSPQLSNYQCQQQQQQSKLVRIKVETTKGHSGCPKLLAI